MSKPHKHADVIKAWADGKEVQWAATPKPNYSDPLAQREPIWSDWTDPNLGAPLFDEYNLWRVKPEPRKWQKEIDAFARGECIQWRSTSAQHAGMAWRDVPPRSPLMDLVFNEPTNEFRIPHKWQAEMDAQARGKVVEASSDGGKTWMKPPYGRWKFDGDVDMLYRITPKTVKTRLRVAAMGHPVGEGKVWIWSASSDAEAADLVRHKHFLCWLHDWKEIERPVPEPSVAMRDLETALAKGFDGPSWIGFDLARGDSRASIGVFYNYCKAGKPSPTKDQAK